MKKVAIFILLMTGLTFAKQSRLRSYQCLDLGRGVKIRLVLVQPPGVRPFYIGATEVTQAQHGTVMDPKGFKGLETQSSLRLEVRKLMSQLKVVQRRKATRYWERDVNRLRNQLKKYQKRIRQLRTVTRKHTAQGLASCGLLPQRYAKRKEAEVFCEVLTKKLGLKVRLPTGVEWEFACAGGKKTIYYFGDNDSQLIAHAWFRQDQRDSKGTGWTPTRPIVGLKRPNTFGLYDVYGNLEEWCSDEVRAGNILKHSLRGGSLISGGADCNTKAVKLVPSGGTKGVYHAGLRIVVEVQKKCVRDKERT